MTSPMSNPMTYENDDTNPASDAFSEDAGTPLYLISSFCPLLLLCASFYIICFIPRVWYLMALMMTVLLTGHGRSGVPTRYLPVFMSSSTSQSSSNSSSSPSSSTSSLPFFNAFTSMALEIQRDSHRSPRILAIVRACHLTLMLPLVLVWSAAWSRARDQGLFVKILVAAGGYWGSR